jgi:hypothetical protein
MLLAVMLPACQQPSPQPLQHAVYVWKRQWRESTVHAIDRAAPDVSAVRILVAQLDAEGQPVLARTRPWGGLPRLPVVAVIRIEGTRLPAAPEVARSLLEEGIQALELGPGQLQAVEIDHDAATSQLPFYAEWLEQYAKLPPLAPALSITTLPDWLNSPQLPRLLHQVDTAVLQVHAVDSPEGGLLDAAQAIARVQRFGERTPVPFVVALPVYWLSAGMDGDGRVRFVEAEAPLARRAVLHGDLATPPSVLAGLLDELDRQRPKKLTGVVWFRLPEAGDRRTFAWSTLRDLINRQPIDSTVQASLIKNGVSGQFDLILSNTGRHEALAPSIIQWPAQCRHGEGVAGYRWRNAATVTDYPPILRPGDRRRLGWAACPGAVAGTVEAAH